MSAASARGGDRLLWDEVTYMERFPFSPPIYGKLALTRATLIFFGDQGKCSYGWYREPPWKNTRIGQAQRFFVEVEACDWAKRSSTDCAIAPVVFFSLNAQVVRWRSSLRQQTFSIEVEGFDALAFGDFRFGWPGRLSSSDMSFSEPPPQFPEHAWENVPGVMIGGPSLHDAGVTLGALLWDAGSKLKEAGSAGRMAYKQARWRRALAEVHGQ